MSETLPTAWDLDYYGATPAKYAKFMPPPFNKISGTLPLSQVLRHSELSWKFLRYEDAEDRDVKPSAPAPQKPPEMPTISNLYEWEFVIDYLNKKGYSQTEAMLRREMSTMDSNGRIIHPRVESYGGKKYFHAYYLLYQWIEENLEVYKTELKRLLWPIYVYSFLNLVADNYPEMSQEFFQEYKQHFEREHEQDLRSLEFVKHSEHLEENEVAKLYRNNSYRLTMVENTHFSLLSFLESKERQGGSVITSIMQSNLHIVTVDRASTTDRSFAAVLARQGMASTLPDEDEGIPGHNPGSANTDKNAPPVLTRLALGPMPMEADALADMRDDLEDHDMLDPPLPGQNSLIDEFDQKIKRENSEDVPSRDNVPYPKPLARDVAADVAKIKESRDRFRLPPRSGGVGPGVSVTMFTFHNTHDSINCIDFSGDHDLVAAGTAESYIRVWTLSGAPFPFANPPSPPVASCRLIGHSGPIYAVSFTPSTPQLPTSNSQDNGPSTKTAHLISASADSTIRLWHLPTATCLLAYRSHTSPIWSLRFSPHGHYFLSASRDRTARLWSTEQVAPLRIFAGHDGDAETVCWHPNGCYVFTGGGDRTVRMWDIATGRSVRLFTGHLGVVTAVECAPNGRTLASADDTGSVLLWDLETGRRTRWMRGHGRGGVWSLAWSVESSVLVSGGADGTVRVWDAVGESVSAADKNAPPGSAKLKGGDSSMSKAGDTSAAGGGAKRVGVGMGTGMGAGTAGAGGKSGRDASVTSDQISCFVTKKTPVYRVTFTGMNLVLAGGAYLP